MPLPLLLKYLHCSVSFFSLQTLTDALCKGLGGAGIKLKSKVLSLSYGAEGKSALEHWSVTYASNNNQNSQGLSFDAVIMTVSISFQLVTCVLVAYSRV